MAAAEAEANAAAQIIAAISSTNKPPEVKSSEVLPTTQTPSASTEIMPVPHPANTGVIDSRLVELKAWFKQGLNASTKIRLPIAVIAPDGEDPNHYLDKHAVKSISSLLSDDLNLVSIEDAALFIEITDARADPRDPGPPCSTLYSMHEAIAHVTVQMMWIGEKPLMPPQDFPGSGESCDGDNAASDKALNDSAAKAKDAILLLANKPAASTANQ